MKARFKRYETTCMLVGYYDEKGEYCEMIGEDLELKNIDESISKNIFLNYDITMHIVPRIEVRVFAKSIKDFETLLKVEGDPNHIKGIFDAFSKHNESVNGEYIHTSFNFEERRRAKEVCEMEAIEF